LVSSFDKYDAEWVALRQLIARKAEHFPEYTREECIQAALDELYDPLNERDPAFRKWLLQRALSVEKAPDGGDEG
jgi:hypothetical protein